MTRGGPSSGYAIPRLRVEAAGVDEDEQLLERQPLFLACRKALAPTGLKREPAWPSFGRDPSYRLAKQTSDAWVTRLAVLIVENLR